MGQFITKFIFILLFLFANVTFSFFVIRRAVKSEIDLFGWFREKAEKLVKIKETAAPTDTTGILKTDEAPLFADKVCVYWGGNLDIRAVEKVGKRQVVRAFKGLDIVMEAGQIKRGLPNGRPL